MDKLQEKLKEMEMENPSINLHEQNIFQRAFNKIYFKTRNKFDQVHYDEIKVDRVMKVFQNKSIYPSYYERFLDYIEKIENLGIDPSEKEKLKNVMESAIRVDGMEMSRILRTIEPFEESISLEILDMCDELYLQSFEETMGVDPIYPNPVFLGRTRDLF